MSKPQPAWANTWRMPSEATLRPLSGSIQPGTALSRSRFEDATFSLGDNLKQGVRTDYGTVRVREHTELELVFNDPATGQLHPGVRETIRKGQNLFVTYPIRIFDHGLHTVLSRPSQFIEGIPEELLEPVTLVDEEEDRGWES